MATGSNLPGCRTVLGDSAVVNRKSRRRQNDESSVGCLLQGSIGSTDTMTPAPRIRLTYFPIRGRAEPLRLMLAYGGIPFEDRRVSEFEWKQMKKDTPFGQLPILQVGNKTLAQSNTIARYLGRELDLNETDSWTSAQLDSLVDGMQDVFGGLLPVLRERDEAKARALLRRVRRDSIKPKLQTYEAFLAESSSGFFGSKQLVWADFVLFCSFSGIQEWVRVNLKAFPAIYEFYQRMKAVPAIKAWTESHTGTPYCLVRPPGTSRKLTPASLTSTGCAEAS